MFIYLILILILLDTVHILTRKSILKIKHKTWKVDKSSSFIELDGLIEIINLDKKKEIMIPEFKIECKVLGKNNFDSLKQTINIKPLFDNLPNRVDQYWQAYILKSKHSFNVAIKLRLEEIQGLDIINDIENVWIDVKWVNYSPFGRFKFKDGFVVPIKYPAKSSFTKQISKKNTSFRTIPIKTHMLGVLDDPIKVVKKYIDSTVKAGDIITIGETPLAIIQGRYQHPSNIKPSILAKVLCYFFHPTSSLATACGMQSLINEVGPSRIILAWLIGMIFKIFMIKGMFYRLAGYQARLIDDITGTTPPYDQVIVLGPADPKKYCDRLALETGVEVAVVDVNDLGRVKILASSSGADNLLIYKALRANPAGNADEQTPIVIVRPS